jgi:Na+-driven multidrug efflux pump
MAIVFFVIYACLLSLCVILDLYEGQQLTIRYARDFLIVLLLGTIPPSMIPLIELLARYQRR